MGKSSFNYWIEIQNMKERIEELMDEVYENFDVFRYKEDIPSWKPIADVYETSSSYVIQLEIPGVEKENISVEIKGKELVVSGERRFIKDVSSTSYHIMERSYGPFYRKFLLPEDVDTSKISANLQNGLLTITVLKLKKDKEQIKIEISTEEDEV